MTRKDASEISQLIIFILWWKLPNVIVPQVILAELFDLHILYEIFAAAQLLINFIFSFWNQAFSLKPILDLEKDNSGYKSLPDLAINTDENTVSGEGNFSKVSRSNYPFYFPFFISTITSFIKVGQTRTWSSRRYVTHPTSLLSDFYFL